MMRREGSEERAREYARAQGVCYGHSAFSPGWYVGTREQLDAIGVADPIEGDPHAEIKRLREANALLAVQLHVERGTVALYADKVATLREELAEARGVSE